MGRGQGPQGGAGNQGGALSSKSAKPRKPKSQKSSNAQKISAHTERVEDEPEAPAYTVIRPSAENRSELVRRTRNDERALQQLLAKKAAASRVPVNGTAPEGEVLGGDVAVDLHDIRKARLQRLESLQTLKNDEKASCVVAQTQRVASSGSAVPRDCRVPTETSEKERRDIALIVAELPIVRRRQGHDAQNDAPDCVDKHAYLQGLTDALLDMLAGRLTREDLDSSIALLRTALSNATKEDPKYRRLKATNDRLWNNLLQHPEICRLLDASGFEQHSAEALEEIDKRAEREHLQLQLQEQLENAETPTQVTVDALLLRLEELQITLTDQKPVLRSRLEDDLASRASVFVHPGLASMEDLHVLLEATLRWTQRTPETDDLNVVH